MIPLKGTVLPFLVTTKDLVGSFSSRIVPYLRILTVSAPVFVTVAVSLRSSIELMVPEGPTMSTVTLPNLFTGEVKQREAKLRARVERKNIADNKLKLLEAEKNLAETIQVDPF